MNAHAIGAAATAFLASFVEFVEALTVVLAVGATRGWRNALGGAAAGVAVLAALLAVLGPGASLPGAWLRLAAGVLSLLFGLRWLRKAVLRAAGLMPLHDEAKEYEAARAGLGPGSHDGWDAPALGLAFQVVLTEGVEVVFIVAATAAGAGMLIPAAGGAAAALAVVLALGVALHRPMTQVPENALKFAVGVMMAAFGSFWTAEAVGARFPGGDAALPLLALFWLAVALALVRLAAPREAVTAP
jgi:uncharacterized membrane protein